MTDVVEIFADTGEIIERNFTPEEAEQRAKDQAEVQAAAAKEAKEAVAKAKARTAAIAHAKSLGFTDEMIAVMYPTLVEE